MKKAVLFRRGQTFLAQDGKSLSSSCGSELATAKATTSTVAVLLHPPWEEGIQFPNDGLESLAKARTSCPVFTAQTIVSLFVDSLG